MQAIFVVALYYHYLPDVGGHTLQCHEWAHAHRALLELYTSEGCSSCPPADGSAIQALTLPACL